MPRFRWNAGAEIIADYSIISAVIGIRLDGIAARRVKQLDEPVPGIIDASKRGCAYSGLGDYRHVAVVVIGRTGPG